jgi:HlyD family secretion protein
MRRLLVIVLLVVAAGAGGLWWWHQQHEHVSQELVLYGNVDLRQVQLAFNNSERIAEVRVHEGERITRGELLARLDTSRLEPQVAQAEANVASQRQVVERMHHGSRPEEKAQALANVESARADVVKARQQYERLQKLSAVRLNSGSEVRAVSQEDLDNAKAAFDVAEAKLAVNEKAKELTLAGPRREDVAQAEAQLRSYEAQHAFMKQQLADTKLIATTDGIVRTRLLEPGEMASPQRPVLDIAIITPKWVRAYVAERDLGKVRPKMTASVAVDSFPGRRFEGWVGFISPVAEFTPKAVQTEELRTSLVYEVRVFVNDPEDELRLGMPATVYLPTTAPSSDKTGASATGSERPTSPTRATERRP